jgi:hypothetical protein
VPQDALVDWVRQETATAVGAADGESRTSTPADSGAPLRQLFSDAGFDRLGERFTIKDATPASKKLGKLLKGRDWTGGLSDCMAVDRGRVCCSAHAV